MARYILCWSWLIRVLSMSSSVSTYRVSQLYCSTTGTPRNRILRRHNQHLHLQSFNDTIYPCTNNTNITIIPISFIALFYSRWNIACNRRIISTYPHLYLPSQRIQLHSRCNSKRSWRLDPRPQFHNLQIRHLPRISKSRPLRLSLAHLPNIHIPPDLPNFHRRTVPSHLSLLSYWQIVLPPPWAENPTPSL